MQLRPRKERDHRVVVAETAVIARSPAEVVGFLLDPRSAVLVGQNVTRAFLAPDRPPRAVRTQFVQLFEHGDTVVVEVVEPEWVRRTTAPFKGETQRQVARLEELLAGR